MRASEQELTLAQAATVAKLSKARIAQFVRDGRLPSRLVETVTGQVVRLVRRADVLALPAKRLPRGPKPRNSAPAP